MKPANLNRLWGLAALATVSLAIGPACDGNNDDSGPGLTATTGANTDGSGSGDGSSSGDESSTGSDSGESSTGEETTGPPPGGLGCGITPDCSKGELDESIYELSSSDQIDEIAGYTKIRGSLEITDTDLECLDFLACLEEVGGDITVFGNDYLEDLSGTNNIRNVGTEFCPEPSNSTTCVAGSIIVSDNGAMEDMNGFDGVLQATIALNVRRNDAVTDISGLNSLVAIWRDLNIQDNPLLTGISGLTGLRAVGGGFVITQNPSLCLSDVNVIGNALEQWSGDGSTAGNDPGC